MEYELWFHDMNINVIINILILNDEGVRGAVVPDSWLANCETRHLPSRSPRCSGSSCHVVEKELPQEAQEYY